MPFVWICKKQVQHLLGSFLNFYRFHLENIITEGFQKRNRKIRIPAFCFIMTKESTSCILL
ncbi:hypothetical protein D7X25_18990 [bacterium 1XD42-8]|nr:hypothetical protein D7X25_18990 [bacterium 1XD42-8]